MKRNSNFLQNQNVEQLIDKKAMGKLKGGGIKEEANEENEVT